MASILTNYASMSALQQLSATQRSMRTTQGQVSSGLRVADASDNAAYWSIGVAMKSRNRAIDAVNDGLALTDNLLKVTSTALTQIIGLVNGIKDDIVSAQQPGLDRNVVDADIEQKQNNIIEEAESATFSGQNLLVDQFVIPQPGAALDQYGNSTENPLVKNLTREAPISYDSGIGNIGIKNLDLFDMVEDGSDPNQVMNYADAYGTFNGSGSDYIQPTGPMDVLSITTPNMNGRSSMEVFRGGQAGPLPGTTSFLDSTVVNANSSDLDALGTGTEGVLKALTGDAAEVGGWENDIDNMTTFNSALSDAITAGVGSLEDADMNLASTRLQALQTQQQLGIQSLSIANQNSQLILKLFG